MYPALGLIEQGATNRLTEQVLAKLPNFTGRHVLEQWFRTKFMETGNFTLVGPWWDRKGLNEIDLVAINPFDKEIVFAEIKRNKTHIDLAELRQKSFSFLAQVPGYSDFKPSYTALSLEDL